MIFAAVLLTVGAIAFTLLVRDKDLPLPEPRTGYEHLEERKARIYEGLRDLQFEYRVGKLSDSDYQTIKLGLQAELAGVLAEIDRIKARTPSTTAAAAAQPSATQQNRDREASVSAAAFTCPHCGASFPVQLKFCGECGKAIA